ncbi:hypothetical protein GJAV_G00156210 [Gymnothorax javanicus]|nr:hypothetical protein GJAV_G00156210 [Gymnothorax javanicus]
MSCFVMSFQTQLASVMEILVKAAISEVTKIVEVRLAGLQAEIDARKQENKSLKLRLLVQDTERSADRVYGDTGAVHVASHRSVGVQVQDGGELSAEAGFLSAACGLWKPAVSCQGDVATPESHTRFALDQNELDCIVIKEEWESTDLEEQGTGLGCVSQEESDRLAGKRCVSHSVVEAGRTTGRHTQGGWGFGLRAGGACDGTEGLFESDTGLQQEIHTSGVGSGAGPMLELLPSSALGGTWQGEPGCGVEQPHLVTAPPDKSSSVPWDTPGRPYEEVREAGLQRCGRSLYGPTHNYLSEVATASVFLSPSLSRNRAASGEGSNSCDPPGNPLDGTLQNSAGERLHNEVERPFSCSLCGKRFGLQRNLKTHQRTHTGEKPYGCHRCDRRFAHQQSLETHQRTHTGEKPFPCAHCGKRFSIAQNLKTHQRTHTGERPYRCAHCGKCFSQLGNLRIHQRTHTGERPYRCTHCGKSFSLLQNLKTHLRIHSSSRV